MIAGFFYFLIVGAGGVSFGILREMFVTPALGRSLAIIVELPFMLLLAWYGCQMIVRLVKVQEKILPRVAMGATAFGLLMVMEQTLQFALRFLLQGNVAAGPWTIGEYMGFAGQLAYGAFPLFMALDTEQET